MEYRGYDRPAKCHLQRHKPLHTELFQQHSRLPHQHEPRLHEALDPAAALGRPDRKICRRIFKSRQVQDANTATHPREAQPEIGVFGDVPRVPSSRPEQVLLAEMRTYVASAPSASCRFDPQRRGRK